MADDDVFITKLDIGTFLVVTTLVAELLIFPLFEFLKDRLNNVIAIHEIASAKTVVLRSDKWWSHWLGVSDNIKTDRLSFLLSYLMKLSFKVLIIGMLAYWGGSANEVTVSRLSQQQLARGRNAFDGIRIMSPMPFSGLSQNEIKQLVTFSPNGAEQSASYAVLDGEDFSMTGDDACAKVTEGRLTVYLSRIEVRGNNIKSICLDGTEKRPTEIVAQLDIQRKDQKIYALSSLTLEKFVATDRLSIIYKVITSHNGKDKEGYAALTKNSHQNGNTVWSFYGILHDRDGNVNKLEYLNIPITGNTSKPCEGSEIGTWRISEESITCPDGREVEPPGEAELTHVMDANWVIPSTKRFRRDPDKLALQWVAETPFSDYVAKTKLSEEVWSRLNRQVFFVSDFVDTMELPESETFQYTQTSRKRVIIATATLSTILLILIIFVIVEKVEMSRHNIKMDFSNIGSVLGMWNSESSDAATFPVNRASVTIGLTEGGDVGVQHIGTFYKGGKSIRGIDDVEEQTDTKVALVKRDSNLPLR